MKKMFNQKLLRKRLGDPKNGSKKNNFRAIEFARPCFWPNIDPWPEKKSTAN